ncbi:hypothetical protein CG709_16990 [Lachnotalea glycerini]|nr:hypothetical protein CG709_16990 [Lachnotalea glycerini]
MNKILAKISEDYEALNKENEEMQNEIVIMKETVKHYKTIEESLQHTLIIAQRTSENITDNATEKANNIISEAEKNAQDIVHNAYRKVDGINHEYEEIKKSLNIYKMRSQALLATTLEMLKVSDDEKNEKSTT